jgi:cytochrome c553
MYRLTVILTVLLLAACSQAETAPPPAATQAQTAWRALQLASNPIVKQGQTAYNLRCAHCHGYDGEGQLPQTIENTLSLGMMTIPPHDSSGHTWQHPDQLLLRTIREGISNPLDQFPMESYAEVMSDDEIMAVIAYIKLWWTESQRAHQAGLTKHWAELDQQLGAGSSE